jgi:hypothetical protein
MNYPVKNALRQLVCKVYETATKDKQTITTVSLPGDSWEFEHFINDNFNFRKWFGNPIKQLKAYCFERNKVVFDLNQSYSKSLTDTGNFEYLNEEINEIPTVWANSESVFSWFDFCGNPTFFNLDYCSNPEARQTHLFTFNLAWRCSDNIPKDILINSKQYENKEEAILNYFKKIIDSKYKEYRYVIAFSITYVSNHTPMILICITNDVGVIIEDYGICKTSYKKTEKLPPPPELIQVPAQDINKQEVYADLLSGKSDEEVMNKHSLKRMQVAAFKAWLTMWGKW